MQSEGYECPLPPTQSSKARCIIEWGSCSQVSGTASGGGFCPGVEWFKALLASARPAEIMAPLVHAKQFAPCKDMYIKHH